MIIINVNTERKQLASTELNKRNLKHSTDKEIKINYKKKQKEKKNKMADYFPKITKPDMDRTEQHAMCKNKEFFLL